MTVVLACVARAQADDAAALWGRRITTIEVACDAPIDPGEVLRTLPVQPGDVLQAAALAEAEWRLQQRKLFSNVTVTPHVDSDGVALTVQLTRRIVINAVRIRGNDFLGSSQLQRLVRVRPGDPLDDALADDVARRIRERYAADGYEAVEVIVTPRPVAAGEADLLIRINEGEPLRITAVEFRGDLPIAHEELAKAAGLKAGDRYSPKIQHDAERRVIATMRRAHYYKADVDSHWRPDELRRGRLEFAIAPGPAITLAVAGNIHRSTESLLGLMDLPHRLIITDGTWREFATRMRRAYQEDGYYFAQVSVDVSEGPPKTVHFAVTEGERYFVRAVDFEGNAEVSAETLRANMATQPRSWLRWQRGALLDDVLQQDLKEIWFRYRRLGYDSAEILDARKRFDADTNSVTVTVVIDEGARTVVEAVEVRGSPLAAAQRPALRTRAGEPLSPPDVEADRRALLTALGRAGYADARVEATVAREPREAGPIALVLFDVSAGTAQRVGPIIVANNFDTRASVVLREVPFKTGDPLNPQALIRAQDNLYRLGRFRNVTVEPLDHPEGGDGRPIAVNVVEKPPGTVQVGGGYNTRDGIRVFGEIGYNNLQGRARRISLRGEIGIKTDASQPLQYLANLGYRDPRLGDSRWVFRADLLAQRTTRSVDPFDLERVALVPAFERPISRGLHLGVAFGAEESNVFSLAPSLFDFNPRDADSLRTVSVEPYLVYDRRDDSLAPRSGVFDTLRIRYAPGELGSQVPFIKILARHSHYIPLADSLTFIYAARSGWAQTIDSDDIVPVRERFYLGGRTTVRGFSEDEISPRGATTFNSRGEAVSGGDRLGGDLSVNLNAELRFPLVFQARGGVFCDGGGSYLQDRAITLNDFRRSAGLGLHYNTPVGPISLDYGFKLDRQSGESLGELHFSIGAIF